MSKRSKKSVRKLITLFVLAVVLLAVASPFIYRHFHKPVAVSGTIPSKTTPPPSEQTTNNNKLGTSGVPSPSGSTSGGVAVHSNLPLVEPWGNFVSNHHPGVNGAPTSETSNCNTTPGASCTIQFTKDGVVKTLEAKTTDNNGAVSWDWDVKTAGLTSGKWQITAIASQNGETKTTTDQLPLEVQ